MGEAGGRKNKKSAARATIRAVPRTTCPHCRERGIITVLAKGIHEDGTPAMLLRHRAGKALVREGRLVITARCPRCHQDVDVLAVPIAEGQGGPDNGRLE